MNIHNHSAKESTNIYPLIFIHKGCSDYLTYTLQCAKAFNPNARVILLGDKTNEHYKTFGIEHCFYEDFAGEESRLFDEVFQYIRGEKYHAPEWLVRFFLKKWFHIFFFIKYHNIHKFWTFDSDTLILCDLSLQMNKFNDYDCTEQCNGICMNGFIGNIQVVRGYIHKIIDLFQDEKYLNKQREELKIYTDWALTEMRAYSAYKERTPIKTIRLNSIIDGETFDDCIKQHHDMEMKNSIKKLYWTENGIYVKHLPTMQFIKVNSLNMSLVPTTFIKAIFEYAIKIYLKI